MSATSRNLKPGTRIETLGFPAMGGFPAVPPEQARITRWNESVSGPRADMPGWHVVKFATGYKLLSHEDSFRVIDNRA